ncbi:MAG: LuxR C-terminal-related transcriptional regulator [Pseudomonadota bacterium]
MKLYQRKQPFLVTLLFLQGACAIFLLYDVVLDVTGLEYTAGFGENYPLEYAVTATLILSIFFSAREFLALRRRNARVEAQLKAASGEFQQLMSDSFEAWELTNSERDMATLAIKGLSIGEIATVRQTREGTIKAQLNAIYRKAGVTGRSQLTSVFVEELLAATPDPAPVS